MIQHVITRGLFVEAPGDEWKIQLTTVYLPGDRRATAVASLARTRGGGSAKTSINYYLMATGNGSAQGEWLDRIHDRWDAGWMSRGPGALTRDGLRQVQFIVGAKDRTFAYAQCMVFLHKKPEPVTLLSILMAPVHLVAKLLGAGADPMDGSDDSKGGALATRAVFDRLTGEVIHIHQLMASPGMRLPDEPGLAADVMRVAERITGRPVGELDMLAIDEQDIMPGRRFKVDQATRRLASLDDPPLEAR